MKRAAFVLMVFVSCLAGQAVDSQATLQTLLTGLRDSQASDAALDRHRDRINQNILSLSEPSHRPSMYSVAIFTARLTDALEDKNVSASQAAAIATEINTVLNSAGLGTWKFKAALSNFTAVLESMKVDATLASKVAVELEKVGSEVRGAQGVPVRPVR